ncbi:MAG: hypothetical protein GY771_07195 [bacterium]|nr:hypothetical protein [bacterium]
MSKTTTKPVTIGLADLARELDMNPKSVRSYFRRIYKTDAKNLPKLVKGYNSRWTFQAKDRAAVLKIMRNGTA